MATFSVRVHRIVNPVEHHPNADRLSLVKIDGYTCISAKQSDGSHTYNVGDLVVYVPEAAVVPEYLLKQGFWDSKKDKGILAGKNGDRVKAIRLRGIFSQGILFPVKDNMVENENGEAMLVSEGTNVAEFLGITKYEPPIPASMSGDLTNMYGYTMGFDLENIQSMPDIFAEGDDVFVTEKLHGTCCQIGYIPGVSRPDLFGKNGNIYVGSKGLAAKGLVFKNTEENREKNIYVQELMKLLDNGLEEYLETVSNGSGRTIHIFGEVYGQGVQDLDYGLTERRFAAFDIAIDRKYVHSKEFQDFATAWNVPMVPIMYSGPFSMEHMESLRDGLDCISQKHMREGIVIKSSNESIHEIHGRRSVKMISPDYLLRKNATEFT